ncbi:hypothetical protein BC826DRAFT_1107525 [Russula brevipes]|nr:hypothetical protein BC826DRAFT_1107525 [Russula brevipes]
MEGPDHDQNHASHKFTERSYSLTIDGLHDELLLEIFDYYRLNQGEDYWQCWKKKFRWFRLIHVCRRWRGVVFASCSRLDATLLVTNYNPGHIKTIFSPRLSPLPIVIDYLAPFNQNSKDLSRVLAALKRCDRIRGIKFHGRNRDFNKFLKETRRPFLSLESLDLRKTASDDISLPATFLGGSVPHLRRLSLHGISAALSLPSFLSTSATTLIDLDLGFGTIYHSSEATSLLACLQGLLRLCRLELKISTDDDFTYPTATESIVPLPDLTRFRFEGCGAFLNAFAARFTAPSLQDVHIELYDFARFPTSHFTRFIGDVKKLYRSAQVIFQRDFFRLSLLTCSESIDCAEPPFRFYSKCSAESLLQICDALSAELATVEELYLSFDQSWGAMPWGQFLRLFDSVKVFRMQHGNIFDLANVFSPNNGGTAVGVLPVLEEIVLCAHTHFPEDRAKFASGLAAFDPFVSARQEAGRPNKWQLRGYSPPLPESKLSTSSPTS